MTLVYIALGSNLASPLEQVQAAIRALGEIPHSRVVAVSSFYRTPPLGRGRRVEERELGVQGKQREIAADQHFGRPRQEDHLSTGA